MAFEIKTVQATNPAVEVFRGRGTQGGPGDDTTSSYLVKNTSASVTVYLGPTAAVTWGDGYPLGPGESLPFGDLGMDDVLFAYAATQVELRVLGVL